MADKYDEILQTQKDMLEELKSLNSLHTTVVEHTIRIGNVVEFMKDYKDKQIPKCEAKFESNDKAHAGIYNRVWWLVGIFLIAVVGLLIKVFAGGKL